MIYNFNYFNLSLYTPLLNNNHTESIFSIELLFKANIKIIKNKIKQDKFFLFLKEETDFIQILNKNPISYFVKFKFIKIT